ncbi:unnamed protein product, partial [marine sediment metagenome]
GRKTHMGTIIKVSSLSRKDQTAFKKIAEGRYVLAKKLQSYDWDTGTEWSLREGEGGSPVLARDDKAFKKHAGLQVLSTKLVCDTCRNELSEIVAAGSLYKLCDKCDEETILALRDTDAAKVFEAPTPIPTGISMPGENNVIDGDALAHVRGWIDGGLRGVTSDSALDRIQADVAKGLLAADRAGYLRNSLTAVVTAARSWEYAIVSDSSGGSR